MDGGIPLGRVAGVPVRAHWSMLIGVAVLAFATGRVVLPAMAPGRGEVFYWLAGALAGCALFGSVLVHELAHALVARRSGVGVRRIKLWMLGGQSELDGEPSEPKAEVRIALAGPLTSLALAGLLLLTGAVSAGLGAPSALVAPLTWLGAMNVMLGVFNLLPGQPLDGGRVLHGLYWARTGDRERATRVATGAGRLIGAALAGIGMLLVLVGRTDGLWVLVVGWFLSTSAVGEQALALVRSRLVGRTVREVMTAEPCNAPGWWTVEAFTESVARGAAPRHHMYPVTDFDGRLIGVVSLDDLLRCESGARRSTPVRALVRALPPERVLAPGAPAEGVLVPLVQSRGLPVVVVEHERPIGLVTATDLRWVTSFGPEPEVPSAAEEGSIRHGRW